MRFLSILILLLITVLEIGPVPITGIVLLGVVVFRPAWFLAWVLKIYDK